MTRNIILDELFGGLWHTTHPDRFKNILKTGAILPEPDIPDRECWKTSQGKDCYPYVRILGGVSLFDFDQFDPDNYTQRCPVSSWYEFVPYQSTWGRAVWIEIDREKVAREVISASDLVVRWNQNEAYRHTIMPYIEAAHLGPVSKTAFKRAFLVCKEDDLLHALDLGI